MNVLKGLSLVNNIKAENRKISDPACGLWLGVLRGGGLNIGCLISSIFYYKFYLVAIERCSSANVRLLQGHTKQIDYIFK